MIPTEATPGDIIGTADITGILHDTHTQTLISTVLIMTLHIEGHLHTEAHQFTHEITADHALDQPTDQLRKTSHQNSSHSRRSHDNMHPKRNSRVTIDHLQTDFYSSDDNSSGSEEDSDHLN